ncbi:hypothetical protein J4457_01085 [Candidatus Woesearchaeota archaeon]|nr:hypothetical protein [Candidatus Woesearchaeota archaeon]
MNTETEEALLAEILRANMMGRTFVEFVDDTGEKVEVRLSKIMEQSICSPYD